MKKILSVIAALVCGICVLAGCGGEKNITVVSRPESSGTRSAFMEIIGLENTLPTTIIQETTNAVLTEVKGNKNAIGYISLGSINSDVKVIKINEVEANAENVINGSYKISRPFEIVHKGELNELQQDFKKFLLSQQAQAIVNKDFVSVHQNALPYAALGNLSGTISISGSTSVSPLMNELVGVYQKLNPNVSFSISEGGSGIGIQNAITKTTDFGMSSRELKESEKAECESFTLAKDGIAVIVHSSNPIQTLSVKQLKMIYSGEVTKFSQLSA